MNELTVTITLEEYKSLLESKVLLNNLERYLDAQDMSKFASNKDIAFIIGHEMPESETE